MLRERRRGEDVAALFSFSAANWIQLLNQFDTAGCLRNVVNPLRDQRVITYVGVRCLNFIIKNGTSHPLAVWPRKKPERKPGGKKTCRANIPPTRELTSIFLS